MKTFSSPPVRPATGGAGTTTSLVLRYPDRLQRQGIAAPLDVRPDGRAGDVDARGLRDWALAQLTAAPGVLSCRSEGATLRLHLDGASVEEVGARLRREVGVAVAVLPAHAGAGELVISLHVAPEELVAAVRHVVGTLTAPRG